VPARLDHVVGADDDLVDRGHLPGGVVYARPVRPVAEQQRVVIGVAGGPQELANLLDPLTRGEAEAVGVEGDGLLLARLGDVQRDVDQPYWPYPARVAERLVDSRRVAGAVPVRVLAALPLDGLAHRQPEPEAGLVNGVRLTIGPDDLAVGGQAFRQVLEHLLGVDAPDDLPQRRAVLGGRRQARIVGFAQLEYLAGLGDETPPTHLP
jgi:hypothetical protein